MDDHAVALMLARAAGDELLRVREQLRGEDPAQVRAAGDAAAQRVLAAGLRAHRPDDAVLSEEAADLPGRLGADRVWVVDPLDGTREFAEPGRTDWAVHVALWVRGAADDGALVAGAVTLPAAGLAYSTGAPSAVPAAPDGPLRLAVSRSRPPASVTAVAERLGAVVVPMGSAGVKATSVLRDEADVYLHAGGQYEWDSAAPVAVAEAAGLHASRVDGSPLLYNRADPYLPDLLVCRPEHARTVLDTVAAVASAQAADAATAGGTP